MRKTLPLLITLLALTAAGEYPVDPFLPDLELGAGPDAVSEVMGEHGWEIEQHGVYPDGRTAIRAGNASGWLLYYEYTPDGDPFSIVLAEVWPEEEQRADSHGDWKKGLSAQFGEPKTVESAYGELLHWSTDSVTVELDLNAPEFYVEGYFTLVVLVLFNKT